MTLSLNDLRRLCRINPNMHEHMQTSSICIDGVKFIDLVFFPISIADPTMILFIENDQNPLFRAWSYPRYGIYTKTKEEAILVKLYFKKREKELQKIICNSKITPFKKKDNSCIK